ncbi:sugar efflux transporter B [mine drainage metagenome]|uniref:Sugar efflux transporter B n=1 Tax=mine drainage metagenome TaxID=410659 RepID=A0A1J5RNG5_9ZZZZ
MRQILERCRPLVRNPRFRSLILLNVLLGLTYSFVSPFFSMFGTIECGMNPVVFGVFMTITAVAGIVIATTLAHYSDTHLSRRQVMILGSVAGALGYGCYAYLRTFWPLLLVGCLLLGLSSITFSQLFAFAREELSASDIERKESAFYMNAFRMFFALSWTIGPAVASWIMIALSFKGLFLSAAACFLLFTAATLKYVPDAPPPGAKLAAQAADSVWRVMIRPDVFAHFMAFVLIFASATIGMMNLPLLVLKTLGGTEQQVGIVYCVSPFFELPFMLYFGMLATRMDPAKVIRIGIAIAIVYYAGLTLVHVPWQVYPMQILSAAVTAVTSGVAISYFQNYLPHHPGTATNLYANAQRIGSTIGYLLFGWLAWRFGYRVVFLTCTVFSAATLGLMYVRHKADTPDAIPASPKQAPQALT